MKAGVVHGAVFDLGWPIADHDHRIDEAVLTLIGPAVWFTAGTAGSKRLGHFAFEPAAGLEVQRLVDRFVAHAHALVIRVVLDQTMGDLFR